MLKLITRSLRNVSLSPSTTHLSVRSISVTAPCHVKEIHTKQEGDTLIVQGVLQKSEREDRMVNWDKTSGACVLCALGLHVKHTDVLIIKQFLAPDMTLLPRNITKLCAWQHYRMRYLVEMANRAGLLRLTNDPEAIQMLPGKFRYKSYHDESLIRPSWKMRLDHWAAQFEQAYEIAKKEKKAHENMLRKARQQAVKIK